MTYPADRCIECGHPFSEHEPDDAAPNGAGLCWHRADGPDGTPTCACEAFAE